MTKLTLNRLPEINNRLPVRVRLTITAHRLLISVLCGFILTVNGMAQNKLTFQGQLSSWSFYNQNNDLPLWLGVRYLPELSYKINMSNDKLIDFDGTANIYGTEGFRPFEKNYSDGKVKPYRLWARYSSDQFELRLGLQKINFGSAALLRPLMWFDQVDPRDPLQLTNGVWGLLGRYYFLNNDNIWLWVLYGNNEIRTWDIGNTNKNSPELGGRFQFSVPDGEAAITFHHRNVEGNELIRQLSGYNNSSVLLSNISENRIGIDGKLNLGAGVWFEGAWINKNKNIGMLTNQENLTAGIDYTFDVGNGLYIIFENLLSSYDEKAFSFSNTNSFSALSLSYPLGILDNVGAILYYDWKNHVSYNFINFRRQYDNISLYLMAYWNSQSGNAIQILPNGNSDAASEQLLSGKGIQFMFVLYH